MEFFDGKEEEERDFEEDLLKEGEEDEDKGMDDSDINTDKIKE